MHASRDELPLLFGAEPAAVRGADWGGLRAGIVSLPAGADLGPLFKGLPNDRCPCPHLGLRHTGTNADNVCRPRGGGERRRHSLHATGPYCRGGRGL